MIYIQERKHDKLCGLNSFFIKFDYNKEIVDFIKSTDLYSFDKNTKEWEIPTNQLSTVLDTLTYFDDIELNIEDTQEIENNVELQCTPKTDLFPHQIEAVKYGLNHKKWLLLDAPGLGKSLSMIQLAEELKEQRGIEHCLIICGINTLKTNWEKEIAKHSHYSSIIIGKHISSKGNVSYKSITERANQLIKKIDQFFIIINIESIRDAQIVEAILNSENKFDMIVFDECHKCAGYDSLQSKNLLKIQAEYMIALTGTLLTNSPLSAYIPLAWIGVERKGNITRFKQTYCNFDLFTQGRIVGFKNLDLLKDEIDSCSLRRTKDLLSLPPKTIINEVVEMDDNHRIFYDNVRRGIKSECDKIKLHTANLLSLMVRLRQSTSCPQVLTSNNIVSSKITRCVDLVEEIVSNGDKVVIFSNFKEPVYQLNDLLKEYNPLIGTGDMDDGIVSSNIDLFQKDETYKVFIGTYAKMSTGVTLNSARYMICIDECWTSAENTQAQDRIHRIGSKESVFIYNLMCENTVDTFVHQVVERKEAMSDFIVDNVQDERTLAILQQLCS